MAMTSFAPVTIESGVNSVTPFTGDPLHRGLQPALGLRGRPPLEVEAGLGKRFIEMFGSDRIQLVRCASPSAGRPVVADVASLREQRHTRNHRGTGDQKRSCDAHYFTPKQYR
jgi:hypothetical protein